MLPLIDQVKFIGKAWFQFSINEKYPESVGVSKKYTMSVYSSLVIFIVLVTNDTEVRAKTCLKIC